MQEAERRLKERQKLEEESKKSESDEVMNALNPKSSLLTKLAQIWRAAYDYGVEPLDLLADPEVIEWYDRMAELEFVPARASIATVVESYDTLAEFIGDKILP